MSLATSQSARMDGWAEKEKKKIWGLIEIFMFALAVENLDKMEIS